MATEIKPNEKCESRLFLRPVSKKCMVKGCRNTRSVAISRNAEFGNTVIICEACIHALARGKGEGDGN